MQKLSKLFFSIIILIFTVLYFKIGIPKVKAVDPIPELQLSCTETRPNEFHSLRPYQAAPCGEAPSARFCSNRLVIFEEFNMAGKGDCNPSDCQECEFTCSPDYQVDPHDLNITLDESEFPIMGNTEDEFDDATKLNEYASWYLNGVIDKKENRNATDDQIVNFSGPLRKLLPSMIQDAQRIKIIESIDVTKSFKDSDTGQTITDAENHDQIVIDDDRLSAWKGDLSFFRLDIFAWDKRTPPLPWDDGTVTDPNAPKIPFKSQILYLKAYKEWQGKSCAILPILGLVCVDIQIPTPFGTIDIIKNKYAELWHFVPLSNNSDKKGKNYLLTADGPNYVAYSGTVITDAKHESYLNAPLYFAHTEEVNGLSLLLNKTFQPDNFKDDGMGFPDDVEKLKKGLGETTYVYDPANPSTDPYDYLDCTAVNVRTNEGDNLFPGDRTTKKELYVKGAEYKIIEATCKEKNTWEMVTDGCTWPNGVKYDCKKWQREFRCPAGVGIEFKLGTETPWAKQIFSQTVAGTGSTFRKIFPKVSEEAPVNCIADIPTTTGVEYSIENDINEKPNGGSQRLGKESIPADGAPGLELTFAHVGSVYEYFLNGIQTALRPKGYGKPIANGVCTPTSTGTGTCKQWLFEKDKGGSFYYDKIITAASQAKCNGKSLNPFWAIGIALNENGGLMSDDLEGLSKSHFGCNIKVLQTIDDKIKCMINTLRNDCVSGKTDEETLSEYGYAPGYVLWPITVLNPGGAYPPPIFGSGFNTEQLRANLLSADWRAAYASVAPIFCPNSPTLPF